MILVAAAPVLLGAGCPATVSIPDGTIRDIAVVVADDNPPIQQ